MPIDVFKHQNLVRQFCKYYNLPINIYHGIYFVERLQVFDRLYGCIDLFNDYQKEVSLFKDEGAYFDYVNSVMKKIIDNITSKPAFQKLMENTSLIDEMSHSEDAITLADINRTYKNKNLYIEENSGFCFVSIDMNKANFSSLRCFSDSIFDSKASWEHFVGEFTELAHLKNSRYFRQYIFGECCPKILPKVEKYIMGNILNKIIITLPEWRQYFYSLNNDEILFKVPDIDLETINTMTQMFQPILETTLGGKSVRINVFELRKVPNTTGYMKHHLNCEVEYKGFDPSTLIQVIRYWDKEPVTPIDLVFVHDGKLAQYMEPIDNPWKESCNEI